MNVILVVPQAVTPSPDLIMAFFTNAGIAAGVIVPIVILVHHITKKLENMRGDIKNLSTRIDNLQKQFDKGDEHITYIERMYMGVSPQLAKDVRETIKKEKGDETIQ